MLDSQAKLTYRLGTEFTAKSLQLVCGTHPPEETGRGLQRFARMLFTCLDHLDKRDDLDFFAAAMLAPEVAMLGYSLEEIKNWGPRLLQSLHVFRP